MSCLPLGLEGFLLRCESGPVPSGGDALELFQEPRVLAVDLERPLGEVVVVEEQGRHRGQLQAYCLIVVTGSICFPGGDLSLPTRTNQRIPAEPALAWKRIPFHLMAVLRSLLRRLAQSPPASKAHENVRHAQTSKSFHPHLSLVRSTNAAPHRTTRAQRRTRTVFR